MRQERGQTLVEIIIALGVAGVILTAVTSAITTSLKNTMTAKNQTLAAQYAQEGMEIVRQMQANNYSTLTTLSGRYCLAQSCTSLTPGSGTCGVYSGGFATDCSVNVAGNTLIRQVDILSAGAAQSRCTNTMQVTVSVLWSDGACLSNAYCHSESLVSCISDTRGMP